jgi:hypothetical protein
MRVGREKHDAGRNGDVVLNPRGKLRTFGLIPAGWEMAGEFAMDLNLGNAWHEVGAADQCRRGHGFRQDTEAVAGVTDSLRVAVVAVNAIETKSVTSV